MKFKNMLELFSKKSEDLGAKGSFAVAQDDGTHPTHLSQTILNRLLGRVLEKEGEFNVPSLFKGRLGWVSCAKHTETDFSSNRLTVLTTLKKCAFTLAEVLITLGIIGVVAAMTLPTLIQNHQKQTYVTGLKKAYANIQNAFAKMAYDEGVTDWRQTYCGTNSGSGDFFYDCYSSNMYTEECFNRLKEKFNVVKSTEYSYRNFDTTIYSWQVNGYFYTNDGMIYSIDPYDGILVDVNGDKGPNKLGRDIFEFKVDFSKNRIIPSGLTDYQTYCTTANVGKDVYGNSNGRYCTAKVLIEGKMDY